RGRRLPSRAIRTPAPAPPERVPLPYWLLRAALFQLPPETAHEVTTSALRKLLAPAPLRGAARAALDEEDEALRVRRWGIDFPNPVGVAAGFDKAGTLFNELAALGFGSVEIGTVTALAQPGNPRPRLFRLPEDRALLNRMGFNNPGAEAVAERLSGARIEPVLGINLGKSKATPLEDATADYLRSVDRLQPFARYLVVNVSSPNTPGLRTLQAAEPLRELVGAVTARVREKAGTVKAPPVLVKLAPDLSDAQVEEAVETALEAGAEGIIATNTTLSRAGLRTPPAQVERLGAGGISGAPLTNRALEVVSRIYRFTEGRVPIVGVGGIASADDAWARIRAGASLLQLYTGFVYGGPLLPRRINRGLLARLRREGLRSLDEAVGLDHR
ncbi:MAG TPA: quinone-dependent dihydroorotate dehydrogenase, partial [Longimicrobiaceae bacterium]|nr:quinone-dependent dihydroorotate dehydrogenase [Longimicrobiaceae bacterium]